MLIDSRLLKANKSVLDTSNVLFDKTLNFYFRRYASSMEDFIYVISENLNVVN